MLLQKTLLRAYFVLLIVLMSTVATRAQNTRASLSFQLLAHEKPLVLGDTLFPDTKSYIVLETFRFYISGIRLFRSGSQVWQEPDSYHLCDLAEQQPLLLAVPAALSYDEIRFFIGIDSVTNEAGAMGGALDPTKGMYWTWQSGYINTRIEGYSNLCQNPKRCFQLHLGGYHMPYQTLQELRFAVSPQIHLTISCDILGFLSQASLSHRPQVMSPGADASRLSELLARCFHLKS